MKSTNAWPNTPVLANHSRPYSTNPRLVALHVVGSAIGTWRSAGFGSPTWRTIPVISESTRACRPIPWPAPSTGVPMSMYAIHGFHSAPA
jgi:hypothetical protein